MKNLTIIIPCGTKEVKVEIEEVSAENLVSLLREVFIDNKIKANISIK